MEGGKEFLTEVTEASTEVTERVGDVLCVLCVKRFDNATEETLRDLCVKHFSF
jgi:hypothetical protein